MSHMKGHQLKVEHEIIRERSEQALSLFVPISYETSYKNLYQWQTQGDPSKKGYSNLVSTKRNCYKFYSTME